MKTRIIFIAFLALAASAIASGKGLVSYANSLQGTDSKPSLSYGNTYPIQLERFCELAKPQQPFCRGYSEVRENQRLHQ